MKTMQASIEERLRSIDLELFGLRTYVEEEIGIAGADDEIVKTRNFASALGRARVYVDNARKELSKYRDCMDKKDSLQKSA